MLYKFIQKLSKEEIRHYKLWSARSHAKGERKDVHLFDQIRPASDPDLVEENLSKKWYGGKKNAMYRLKNRVQQDLNESIWHLQQSKDPELQIWQWVGVARHWFKKREHQLSAACLRKAELIAEKHELLDSLQLVYDELVKVSHHVLTVDVEEIVRKRKESTKKLRLLREMDDLQALVSQRVKTTQSFSKSSKGLYQQLEQLVNSYQDQPELQDSKLFRGRMFKAVSRLLLQQLAYEQLYQFTHAFYTEFTEKDWFKENKDKALQLQMLTFLANASFKTKDYEGSLNWAKQIKKMIDAETDQFQEYRMYYYNIRVINLSVTDKEAALKELDLAENDPIVSKMKDAGVFLNLNKFLLLFDTQKFKPALKSLNQLYIHDTFPQLAKSFRFRIAVAELIVRAEHREPDSLDYRMRQILKDFSGELKSPDYARESEVVHLIQLLSASNKEEQAKEKAKEILSLTSDADAEDTDVIHINPWLRKRFNLKVEAKPSVEEA